MLHDRDYMRGPSFDSRTSLTVKLVILLIGLFVIQCCLQLYWRLPLYDWFALSLQGFKDKHYWQLLTFQFMHSYPWPWHVLFNCLALWFFGRSVEETLGSRQFLILYLASGLFGGVVQLLTIWALPLHFDAQVVGASAGVMGLLAAYATLYPMREITFFIFVFPVTLRAQYVFWLALGWSLFGVIVPYSNVADAAHLGGLLMGVAYIRWGNNAQHQLSRLSPFQSRQRKLELVKAASVSTLRSSRPRKDAATDLPSDEFISREVDPILDKISAHGIQSLTDRERQILEAARSRMSRR
jgi:membrane associated rhomboid family serine protease